MKMDYEKEITHLKAQVKTITKLALLSLLTGIAGQVIISAMLLKRFYL